MHFIFKLKKTALWFLTVSPSSSHRSNHEAEAASGAEDVQGADRELLQGPSNSNNPRQPDASQIKRCWTCRRSECMCRHTLCLVSPSSP